MWLYLALLSAFFLGIYDLFKKHALNKNAVLPTLFISTLSGTVLIGTAAVLSMLGKKDICGVALELGNFGWKEHAVIFLKSAIVGGSWVLSYLAIKHLPISIAAPLRALGPVWTTLAAIVIFSERPQPIQWIGLVLILGSYYRFSVLGLKEGIVFHKNKWILFMVSATILGAISGLLDKHLMQKMQMPTLGLQLWFNCYLLLIFSVLLGTLWFPKRRQMPFTWRWSIPAIGITLIIADFIYFGALAYPDALIALVSALRRCSVIISFFAGAMLFREVNRRKKAIALIGVFAGMLCILLGK